MLGVGGWLWCAAVLACAVEARAEQTRVDYSASGTAEVGALELGSLWIPPWPLPPYDGSPEPNAVGRFWGQASAAPTYQIDAKSSFGLQIGVYSNDNTGSIGTRGVVPFDTAKLYLTRIKPPTALGLEELALFYDAPLGRLEVGFGPGVSERTAVVGPHDYGVGGYAGDYPYFFDKPRDVGFNTVSAYGSANTSPRVLYLSPRVYGLQAGVSYQPDTREADFDFLYGRSSLGVLGRGPTATGTYEGLSDGFVNVVEAGANFDQTFGGFRAQASLAGIRGDPVSSPTGARFNGLASYQAGLQLSYGDWSVGGGFVNAGTSGYANDTLVKQRKEQYDFYGGAQYAPGKWTFGAGFLYSSDEGDPTYHSNRQLYVYSIGARYRFAKDFDVGLELDRVETLSADWADSRSNVAIVALHYAIAGDYPFGR